MNTIDANTHLGLKADARDFEIAIKILQELNISKVNLLTNNPAKMAVFENSDIEVVNRIPLITEPIPENKGYLDTKQQLMGHLLGK